MPENLTNAFCNALVSQSPAQGVAGENDLYNGLVGSWRIEVFDSESDGSKRVSGGEWHFARILEGRGVQDVLIVPARDERGPRIPNRFNRYGSSLRIFDANDGIWRVHWCNPVDGEIHILIASRSGGEVVESGVVLKDGPLRWIFSAIAANSFEARAETEIAEPDGQGARRITVKIHATRQDRLEQLLSAAARPR